MTEKKKICPKCGKEVSAIGFWRHEKYCNGKTEAEEQSQDPGSQDIQKINLKPEADMMKAEEEKNQKPNAEEQDVYICGQCGHRMPAKSRHCPGCGCEFE